MSREWWAGDLFGVMLTMVIATLYRIALASKYPTGRFAFMCIRHWRARARERECENRALQRERRLRAAFSLH